MNNIVSGVTALDLSTDLLDPGFLASLAEHATDWERARFGPGIRELAAARSVGPLEESYDRWLPATHRPTSSTTLPTFHRTYWDSLWPLEPGIRPKAMFKAASCSPPDACGLYVSGTQEQADDHVGNVASSWSPERSSGTT